MYTFHFRDFFKKIRIKDPFRFVSKPSTAYLLIIVGLIHFVPNAVAIAKLNRIQWYNWGIYAGLGLADSYQIPIMIAVLIFDLATIALGAYFLKHVEPSHKKREHDYDDEDGLK